MREMTSGEPALDEILPGRLNRDGIRIHAAEDFAGMRAAGRLAAEILDRIGADVVPGVSTLELDAGGARDDPRRRRHLGDGGLQGLPARHLHLDQPRGLPRHPVGQAAAGRRHPEHRRDGDRRRLVRRLRAGCTWPAGRRARPSG